MIAVAGNVLSITGAPSELVFAMYGLTLICAAIGQGLRHVRIVNPGRAERDDRPGGRRGGAMRDGLISASIATAILAATPVLIAATGELLAEVVGVYNIGIEGAMLCGALGAFIGAQQTDAVILGILAGMLAGALASLIFAVAVVIFKADIVVGGLALVFLGFGLTGIPARTMSNKRRR